MHIKHLAVVAVLITPLSGCLDTDLERGIAGAAGGALLGEAIGGGAVLGAVLGGAAGVFCDDVGVCN